MPTTPVPGPLRRRSPRVALTALVALAAMCVSLLTATAGAQTDATPAEAAASWLADQLVDGERYEATFGDSTFPDQGLTIDGILAFAAAGVAEGSAADATDWLEESSVTSGYIGDGTTESYAGALAKLAFLAQVRGLDPTSWGEDGTDLVTRLKAREQPSGRFSDQSAWGDFSNSIGQSLAIIVLTRQPGETASSNSIDLLLQSQCDDGGFALELEPAADACNSGVDTTAYAIQALTTAGAAAAEVTDAVDYLLAAQNDDGGFGTNATDASNANSSGLGVLGLRVAGEDDAADDGVTFLQTLQLDCDVPEEDRGAVDFDGGEFDESTAVRATTQAVLGFAGEGFDQLDSDGASSDLPRFVCSEAATATTTTTTVTDGAPAAEATATGSGGIAPAPVATAVRLNPALTG